MNVTQPRDWRYVTRHTLSGDFMAANWLRLDSTLAINMDHVTRIERSDETVVFSFIDGGSKDAKLATLPEPSQRAVLAVLEGGRGAFIV